MTDSPNSPFRFPLHRLLDRNVCDRGKRTWLPCLAAIFLFSISGITRANEELAPTVRALLKSRCVKCHGPIEPKGELDLSTFAGLARGAAGVPVVVPNQAEESSLWQRVHEGTMPPEDSGEEPLSPEEVKLIGSWIAAGAPGLPAADDEGSHWAFQPVSIPTVPQPEETALLRNDIDHFIQKRLEEARLSIAEPADKTTLIRRVSFDVTGLPPTPQEIASFLTDTASGAYERMVDRYLASPHYGERWGKYWLDAAGYADSNGYFNADSARPLAYRYRDYVIRSLNDDTPIDAFVRAQLAGDEIAGYVSGGDVTPEMVDLLTATHYLRNSQDGTGESDGNPDERLIDKMTVLEGALQITMTGLLGITIQCARCHSHKFEPIHHDEYYRLQAIFFPAYCPDRWSKPNERKVEIGTRAEREAHKKKVAQVEAQIAALNSSLEAVAAPLREQLRDERLAELEASERELLIAALAAAEKDRSEEQKALVDKHKELTEIAVENLAERFPEFASFQKQLEASIAEREKERPPPLEEISVLVDAPGAPIKHFRYERGSYKSPAEEVEPGVPAALSTSSNEYQIPTWEEGQPSTGRRLEFARWVTSPDNPLFGRVYVNRVWHHHFGIGIVPTTDNLGLSGAPATNPELLDYLVSNFVREGFRAKALHRLILCSATYRQRSTATKRGLEVDPENQLYWRFTPRRLDAEAIRDAMLAVSGTLDRTMGGPPIGVSRNGEGSVVIAEDAPGAMRRSIYLRQRRTEGLTMLELFDAPVLVTNCTSRSASTVPLQSLALLNSDFTLARARGFANRLLKEEETEENRISLGFLLALGRGPNDAERQATNEFLASQSELYMDRENARELVWNDFCQMLLSSSAFLYVE